MQEIYNVIETAKILRVDRLVIYDMLKEGKLQARKVGREWRIPERAIEQFFNVGGGGEKSERAPREA
jgi:excisionase family DNA binding protein